jgi:hypothetical protein
VRLYVGVVDQDVYLAKFLNHFIDKCLIVGNAADAALEELGFATLSRDVLQGSFGGRLIMTEVDGDRCTSPSQSQADGVSDDTFTADDNSHFVRQYHGA